MGGEIWGRQAGICDCGGEDDDEVKAIKKRKERQRKERREKVRREKKVWNPGAVFLSSDTTWEQCRGGSVVMKREAV